MNELPREVSIFGNIISGNISQETIHIGAFHKFLWRTRFIEYLYTFNFQLVTQAAF